VSRNRSRGGAAKLRPVHFLASVFALLVLACLAVITESSKTNGQQSDGPASFPAPRTAEAGRPELCSHERVSCFDLGKAWGVVIRGVRPSEGAVIWERGGPGSALPVDIDIVRRDLPQFVYERDVLIVSEPWERHLPDDPCRSSLGEQMRTLLDDETDTPPTNSCDFPKLWWTASSYRDAVMRLVSYAGVFLQGLYADSFGATRAGWIKDVIRGRKGWQVLNVPAPAPGAITGAELIGERAKVVVATAAREYSKLCISYTWACRTKFADLFRPSEATGTISSGDLSSALLWATYDWTNRSNELWRAVDLARRGERSTLKKLSFAASYRSGASTVFPNLAGYLAGICVTYGHWPRLHALAESSAEAMVAARLARMHIPCHAFRPPVGSVRIASDGCAVINKADPVAPSSLLRQWLDRGEPGRILAHSYPGHGSVPPTVAEKLNRAVHAGTCRA